MFNTTTVPTHHTCTHAHAHTHKCTTACLNSPPFIPVKHWTSWKEREGRMRKSEAQGGEKKKLKVEVEDKGKKEK